jgi:hypothetical protein
MLKWVQDWGLVGKIVFWVEAFRIKQVNERRPDCSCTWTQLCKILLLGGLLTKFLLFFFICDSVLALFSCTGFAAFIGWPVDHIMIPLKNRMCYWGWYCIMKAVFVFECTYIPWIRKFAKMTGCGISHKCTVCIYKYTELLKYKHFKYFIYNIMDYPLT